MISYEVYKIIHLTCLVLFFSTAALSLLANSQSRLNAIIQGVVTLLIFISGMGLMARLGISHSGGYPSWILIKFAVFFLIAIGVPVVRKRLPEISRVYYVFSLILFVIAAWVANTKSF